MRLMLLCAGLLAGAAPALAGAAGCPKDAAPPGWAARRPLAAAADLADLRAASLAPGRPVDLALRPTAQVRYALPPEKPAQPASSGGMAGLRVERAGTYRVALGNAAWIDVVRDGKAVRSGAHSHGPACSGIRKMVDFVLAPGIYVIQIAGSAGPATALLVTRLP